MVAAAAVASASALIAGCGPADSFGPDGSKRGVVAVAGYEMEGTLVTLIVMSCNGDPKATVTETDAEVRVSVVSTTYKESDACQDPVEIQLANPLGDRPIIDESSDSAVPNQGS